jgi:hypothetical protein
MVRRHLLPGVAVSATTGAVTGAAPIELAADTPEALYELFEARGWGDGLPLVAPTDERVGAMLAGAPGDPDEVLAVLPPRSGLATRRTVAVNAVLAGCRPEWMPVLVAAARALGDPALNLRGVNATTHPVAPLLIVHGPIARATGFNAGFGAFGPGNRANATVGRAVRHLLLHVAGATPGDGDVSTQGQPAKYTYCVAENVERSPWGAYHHSAGVTSDSAVTVHCGEGPHNFHDMEAEEARPILDKAASVVATLGSNNACIAEGEIFVLLGPEHAATIAGSGWSRSDVAAYLFEKSRLPARVLRAAFDSTLWPPWMRALDDDDRQPMTAAPDHFKVMVVGGPGKHSCVVPSWGVTRSVTVPVEG